MEPTHQKNHKKPRHWDVSGLWAGAFSEIAKTAIKWLRRIKNMYKSEQYLVSRPEKAYILTKRFFYSWRHLLTKCHCTLSFLLFLMFNNSILSLQKASKRQTLWSYKMTWHLKTLTKWTLENPQLCLLGALLQKGLVRGLFVTTKWPYINHL